MYCLICPLNNPVKQVLLFPFYRWGKKSKPVRNLSEPQQLVSRRARTSSPKPPILTVIYIAFWKFFSDKVLPASSPSFIYFFIHSVIIQQSLIECIVLGAGNIETIKTKIMPLRVAQSSFLESLIIPFLEKLSADFIFQFCFWPISFSFLWLTFLTWWLFHLFHPIHHLSQSPGPS